MRRELRGSRPRVSREDVVFELRTGAVTHWILGAEAWDLRCEDEGGSGSVFKKTVEGT